MNDKNVNISLKKLLENPSNRFLINGSNNNQIIGTNIHINHYTLTDKPKIKKVVEDHQYDANIAAKNTRICRRNRQNDGRLRQQRKLLSTYIW